MSSDQPGKKSSLSYLLYGVLRFLQGNRTNSSGMHFRVIPELALILCRRWAQATRGKVDNPDEQAQMAEEGAGLGFQDFKQDQYSLCSRLVVEGSWDPVWLDFPIA